MRARLGSLVDGDTHTEALVTKLLGATIVLSLVAIVVFSITPFGTGETYTEFYVLGTNGTASDYPDNLTVGETATVRIGVGNFENGRRAYTLVVRTNETTLVTRDIVLGPGERWEEPASFAFDSPGRKRLRLELYGGQSTDGEPYRSLRLYVEVSPE